MMIGRKKMIRGNKKSLIGNFLIDKYILPENNDVFIYN